MKSRRYRLTNALGLCALALSFARAAVAQSSASTSGPAASSTPPTATNTSPELPSTWSTCRESVPPGKTRPDLVEVFPSQIPAGHAGVLQVTVTHGKGERVIADAFDLQRESDGAKALRRAGFEFPSTKGPGAPRVTRTEREADAVTVVELSVLALPKKAGPETTSLPPLPIAIARASGEVMTVCTSPHATTITDPTANVPNATPKRHPGGERQRELWVGLRNLTYGALLGLTLAALIYALTRWLRRRPKPLPPPPPARPAWEIALTALTEIRYADLIRQGLFTSHLERVNHVLRQYLGGRYGFDGLESTTEEVLTALQASDLPSPLFTQVEHMLRESDLVKFAKLVPTENDCRTVLDDVESIVRKTMHVEGPAPPTAFASPDGVADTRVRPTPAVVTIPEAPGQQPNAAVSSPSDAKSTSEEKPS